MCFTHLPGSPLSALRASSPVSHTNTNKVLFSFLWRNKFPKVYGEICYQSEGRLGIPSFRIHQHRLHFASPYYSRRIRNRNGMSNSGRTTPVRTSHPPHWEVFTHAKRRHLPCLLPIRVLLSWMSDSPKTPLTSDERPLQHPGIVP